MSDKKKNEEQSVDDFDFIFNNDVNQKAIEKKLKQIKIRNQLIIAGVILAICGFFTMQYMVEQSNKDYVDGNILKIAAGGTDRQGVYNLANPWKNASFIGSLLFSPLFLTDSSMTEINPALAESYTVSSNGLTYTVSLKENIYWSDGVAITPEDVVFSIESFLLCSAVNSNIATAFNKIVGAEEWKEGESSSLEGISISGNDVVIELQMKYNNFAMMLTQFVLLPKHILEDWEPELLTSNHDYFINETPVVSGRFYCDHVNDEDNIVLLQNEHYWGVPSSIEQVIAYKDWQNMEIDYFATTDLTQMVTFRSMKNYTEYEVDVFFYRYFIFNIEGCEDVADVKVRQAVNHAIDIGELFSTLYQNAGSLVYSGNPYTTEPAYPYDPGLARNLLIEADYDFGHTFQIAYYYSDQTSRLFLEKVQDYLEAIGMQVELVRLTSAALYDNPTYDMMLKGLSAYDNEDWYNEYLSTNANLSALLGTNEIFDSLVNAATSSVDVSDYRNNMSQLETYEQEMLYKLPLFTLGQNVYINTSRISLPEDMSFGNIRYQSALDLNSWSVKKS